MPRLVPLASSLALAALAAAVLAVPARAGAAVAEPCPRPALSVRVECLRITVPERHARPGGRTISLLAAILRSPAAEPAPDPVLFLAGGPGEAATDDLDVLARSPLLARRDVIVLDQRGTGRSRPALRCPEFERATPRFFAPGAGAATARRAARRAVRACRDRLRRAGVDLGAYSSTETAQDVEAVRRALGAPAVNLYGVSYGTRAALSVLRAHPAGVRSAVLDSGAPTTELETPPTALIGDVRAGLSHLFAGCGWDARCSRRHPRLARTFDRMVRSWDARPVRLDARLGDGRRHRVEATGADAAVIVWNALKDEALIPAVPGLITAFARRDAATIRAVVPPTLAAATEPGRTYLGTQLSVDCADGGRGIGAADRRLLARPGRWATFLLFASGGYCADWGVPPAPRAFNDPVVAETPALLIAGGYDPISLPAQTRAMGAGLRRHEDLLIPGAGHVPSQTGACAEEAVTRFVEAPLSGPPACAAGLRGPVFR